jgi:hypothetical protein
MDDFGIHMNVYTQPWEPPELLDKVMDLDVSIVLSSQTF